MNKKIKFIVIILCFIVLMAGAFSAYKTLAPQMELLGNTPSVQSGEGGNTAETVTATDFTVYDSNQNEFKLSDMKGKPTVVNFWATWCPPCVSELPHFEKLYKEYSDKVNFMIVNIDGPGDDAVKKAEEFIKDGNYSFPIYYDLNADGVKAYAVRSIPLTLFIGADGNVIATQLGSMNEKVLRTYLEKICN